MTELKSRAAAQCALLFLHPRVTWYLLWLCCTTCANSNPSQIYLNMPIKYSFTFSMPSIFIILPVPKRNASPHYFLLFKDTIYLCCVPSVASPDWGNPKLKTEGRKDPMVLDANFWTTHWPEIIGWFAFLLHVTPHPCRAFHPPHTFL
jgi:hypothetical protein